MEPVYQFPASPGTPLWPVSPERVNRQAAPQQQEQQRPYQHGLAHSPSLPSTMPFLLDDRNSGYGHSRGSSEVQGKVAQFNGLAKEAAQRRKDNEAALKRAILGREEAEGESRRLRDGNDRLRMEVEEGRSRERRVGERLEAVQEELQRTRETQAHERPVFEKEVRRARKEAFKSSSTLVNMQEELKTARNRYTLMREEMESQRRLKVGKEQETFHVQCQMTGLQKDLEVLKDALNRAEEERDVLKRTLEDEEIEKAATQGAIALPSPGASESIPSPRKRRREERESLKENLDPLLVEDEDEVFICLTQDLRREKRLRTKAEEEAHFLHMECQFGVCSCRMADKHDTIHIPGGEGEGVTEQPIETSQKGEQDVEMDRGSMPMDSAVLSSPIEGGTQAVEEARKSDIVFSPLSGTFSKTHALEGHKALQHDQVATQQPWMMKLEQVCKFKSQDQETLPQTPRPLPNPPVQQPMTIHTTTRFTSSVPLQPDDVVFNHAPNTPGGISREEALEQIRLRRGRARSFAAGLGRTPAKSAEGTRRQISAPVGKTH